MNMDMMKQLNLLYKKAKLRIKKELEKDSKFIIFIYHANILIKIN
jgi:hypothetical protein